MNIESQKQYVIYKQENEYGKFYSIRLAKKDNNDNWISGFLPIRFRKDVEVENESKIYIKKAWLDFYKTKQDATQVYVFISEFESAEEVAHRELNNSQLVAQVMQTEVEEDIDLSTIEISDDDLPF